MYYIEPLNYIIDKKFRVGLPSTNKHRKDEEVLRSVTLLPWLVWTFFYSFKTIQWQFAIPVPQEFREEGKKSFNTTNLIITMEY